MELIQKIAEAQLTDPTIEVCAPDDFEATFLDELRRDYAIVEDLNNQWKLITEDPKIDEFIDKLDSEFLSKEINPQQKLVVFSESKETTNYITNCLNNKVEQMF